MAGTELTKKEFVEVYGDDWVGLYIDGKLSYEGHDIDWKWVVECQFGAKVPTISANPKWLEERGSFPNNLEDVQKEE